MEQFLTLIPDILYWLVTPLTAFYFFCQYCAVSPKWYCGAAYTAAFILLLLAEAQYQITGAAGLVLELLLLTVSRGLPARGNRTQTAAMAALILSVLSVCRGTAQLFFYWALSAALPVWTAALRYSDMAREIVSAILAVCFLSAISKYFRQLLSRTGQSAAVLLAVPVFYISLVERTIHDSIYGNTITIDTELGLVEPAVHHGEILLLQVFAGICLFLTLLACQKITDAFLARQTIQLLSQQTQAQEVYIREAQARYEQTRSFRHDIKNHLTVLTELLHTNQTSKASEYLSQLDSIAAGLSYPVRTGCTAADALLGSKLTAARQENIRITCEVRIPDKSTIPDIDWCIILSNAVDNAVLACGAVPDNRRFIRIKDQRKGNFYLLSVENSCTETLSAVPEEGIGLSNIRAAAEKHRGTVQLHVKDGVFRLDVLFILSHRREDTSQQSP